MVSQPSSVYPFSLFKVPARNGPVSEFDKYAGERFDSDSGRLEYPQEFSYSHKVYPFID
jgi:hypothetical protein